MGNSSNDTFIDANPYPPSQDHPPPEVEEQAFEKYSQFRREYENLSDPRSQIRDPLSQVTRKQRRSLLGASLIAFIIVTIGMKPDEITAIGFKFNIEDIHSFYLVLMLVISYFLIAFITYSASDFIDWRLAVKDATQEMKANIEFDPNQGNDFVRMNNINYDKLDLNLSALEKSAKPTSYIRGSIEFLLPILFSLYTLYLVLTKYA